MPGENIMKLGEQWEIEMPGFGKMTVRNYNKKKITNTNKKTKQNEQKNKQRNKWKIEMPGFGKMTVSICLGSHLISNVDILHDLKEIKYLSCRECFWSTVTVSRPA